jgi:hypothetical protein
VENYVDLIPRATIHPDKICLYSEVNRKNPRPQKYDSVSSSDELAEVNMSFLKSARKNNGFLSTHAKRKMFKAIDYLVITSDRKKVYSKLQKKYITFRIVFVTLTLPSKQIHSDKEITNTCLNQLFVELSKYHNVKKYVWRAEKQTNGNIHYHVLINEFIDYQILRKRWNRICEKLGYVSRYQANMKEFYKDGFRVSTSKEDKRTIEQQRKAFILAQKSDFRSPNSTDIHDTRKVKDIKKYVGKYMAKDAEIDLNNIESDEEKKIIKARLWSCSQNLSNIEGCQLVEDWEISDELEKVAEKSKCKIYRDTYFSVMFIDSQRLIEYGSEKLYMYFANYLLKKFDYHLQLKTAI